jgi:hypothetical protein
MFPARLTALRNTLLRTSRSLPSAGWASSSSGAPLADG